MESQWRLGRCLLSDCSLKLNIQKRGFSSFKFKLQKPPYPSYVSTHKRLCSYHALGNKNAFSAATKIPRRSCSNDEITNKSVFQCILTNFSINQTRYRLGPYVSCISPNKIYNGLFFLSCNSRLKYDTTKYFSLFGSVYVILHRVPIMISPTKRWRTKFWMGLREKAWDGHIYVLKAHSIFNFCFLFIFFFWFYFSSLKFTVILQFQNGISHVNRACAECSFADHNKIYDAFICGPLLFNLYRPALV